jgi:hypothetical protein
MNKFKCIKKLLTIESRPTYTSLIICGRVGLRGDSIKVTRIKFPWIIPFFEWYVLRNQRRQIQNIPKNGVCRWNRNWHCWNFFPPTPF